MIVAAAMTKGLIESSENPAIELSVTLFIELFHACCTPVPKTGIAINVVPETLVIMAMATTPTPTMRIWPMTSVAYHPQTVSVTGCSPPENEDTEQDRDDERCRDDERADAEQREPGN